MLLILNTALSVPDLNLINFFHFSQRVSSFLQPLIQWSQFDAIAHREHELQTLHHTHYHGRKTQLYRVNAVVANCNYLADKMQSPEQR